MRLSQLLVALVDGKRAIELRLAGLFLDGAPPLDDDLRSALHRAAAREAADDLTVEQEGAQILATLAPLSLAPLLWKGRAIAIAHWPEARHRPAGDLDLVLEPTSIDAAARALVLAGYRRAPADPTGRWRASPTGIELLPPPGRKMAVDLHARFFRSVGSGIDTRLPLARARPSRVAGVAVRLLDPADELHLVYVHAAKHGVAQMKWLLDLCALAAGAADAIFEEAAARAAATGTTRPFHAAARVAAIAGAPVPEKILTGLAPPRSVGLLLDPLISVENARSEHPPSRAARYALELALEESVAARARGIAGLIARLARRG